MLDAEKYRKYMNVYTGLDSVFPHLQEKMQDSSIFPRPIRQVLDYGSGCGNHIRDLYLPQTVKDQAAVIGIDVSPSMVDYARKNVTDPRASFLLGDIFDPNISKLKFDKIYSTYVLHYIQDYRKAMEKFYEILNPGGVFGFILYSKGCQYDLYRCLSEDPEWCSYFEGLKNLIPPWLISGDSAKDCYRNALVATGFEIIELFSKVEAYFVPSYEVLAEAELAMNPYVNNVPADKMTALKQKYLNLVKSMVESEVKTVDATASQVHRRDEMLLGIVRKPLDPSQNQK